MKKKFLGRVLTMLLVASMVFTLLPAPAIAAGNWWWNNEAAESLADTTDSILPHRIIHLDCGRKYFSVGNVKSLIDVMAAYGYNELELAFGNAGLRFLLGDMSISFTTENGTTSYSDNDIRTAVVEGNKNQNSSGDGSYWTEADMTEILGYASSKNIEIVPLLNMPGHMNALLDGEKFHQYRISGTGYDENTNKVQKTSCTSIDPGKADAAAFGHAILQKYVKWFKDYNDSNPDGKVKYFNFGADEVGNDIVNPFYANNLNPNRYNSCVEYINGCASIIEAAGMLPRAFNDFLYFYYGNVQIDKNIEVCYWNNQWGGSPYASANAISSRGHKMINTNSEWYYVLGAKNKQEEVDNNLPHALNSVETYNYNDFFVQGQAKNIQTIANTAGVMLCIWCDNPNAESPETAIKEATQIFARFAEKNSAVFPAKGEIPPTPQPEPTEPTTKDIYIAVGKTHTETIDGNYPGLYEGIDTSIATVTGEVIPGTTAKPTLAMSEVYKFEENQSATGVISDGNGNYLKVSGESLTNTTKIEEATKFTVVKTSTNKATIQVTDTNSYLKLMNTSGSTSSIMAVEESYEWEVGLGSDFCWYAGLNNYYYLAYYGENWTSNNNWAYAGHLYAVEPGTTSTADKTKLTFTGLKRGDTEVTIGNVTYKVHVTDALADNGDLYVDFWVTSSMITPKNIATTNQNGHIYATYTKEQFSSEGGVLLSDVIPRDGTYQTGTGTSATNHDATYWKTRYLPNECRQKADGWTNKNGVGTDTLTEGKGGRDVERIRYWEGKWQYLAVNGGEWTTFTTSQDTSGNQMAAYYVIKTNVTKEVTTYVTDWSDEQTQEMYGVALDFCVKYPSQDMRVPATFKNSNTQWFNCKGEENSDAYNNGYSVYASGTNVDVGSWKGMRTEFPYQGDWYRVINHIEVTEDQNYEVYMITATPSTSFSSAKYPLTCPTSINYTGTERVLWAKNESVVTDSGLTKHSDYKMGGSPVIERVMIQQCSGMLLTYYVRPKAVANPLTVHFRELNAATDFASYQIIPQVPGTTFDSQIALPKTTDHIGNLENATITNDVDVDQTVTSDLRNVPGVPTQYRKTAFKCVELTKTDDLKEITLYYTFDNSVAFVADFGLPLTITPKDVNSDLTAENITGAAVSGGSGLTVDTRDPKAIVVTPNKDVASKTSTSFTLTYTGTGDSVTYLVYILPASNVLYEENFLTQSGESGLSWTQGTPAELGSQETQKVGDTTHTYNVFGRDTAYDNVTGELGAWTADGLVAGQGATKDLSTEFYGNGFDLIGNCGPDTGRVFLFISGANQIKLVDVDTRYSGNTLNQVPLAHVMLGQEANYQVKVSAAGLKATDATSASYSLSGAATYASDYAVGGYDADLYNVLAENGLTMADVEYVKVESVPAATTRSAASFYALDTADVGGTVTHEAGTHVEIDGFRVYRSSANNTNYPKSEQDVRYLNILDAVDSFTAFVEGSAADSEWKARDKYESAGGPQNEIYLRETNGENSAIAFKTEIGEVVQISARAVENNKPATLVVNGVATVIETNTEMYYTFTPDENGIVTIKNTGKGMLALGNLKIKKGTQVAALSEEDYPAAIALLSLNAAPETPDEGFNPAINAKVTTTRFIRSKVVTLTVSASSDVAVLEVNGVELRPTNSWLVKMGWSDTYTYILTEKVPKSETKTYEIVGYRADGAASAPIVVESK